MTSRLEVPGGPRASAVLHARRRFVRAPAQARRGMTLIEVLIVMALIALLMGTMMFGSGLFGGADRRAAATLVVAAVRKGMAHANTTGYPVRLAIDIDGKKLMLEESISVGTLREKAKDEDEEEAPAVKAGAAEASSAQEEAERVLSGASGPSSSFSPVPLLGRDGESAMVREFGKRVIVRKVQTEHDEEPITNGVAYIYFWPGGVTERSIVQLGLGGDDDGLTVSLSPLTGRATIEKGQVELPESRFDDEEFSEREEP